MCGKTKMCTTPILLIGCWPNFEMYLRMMDFPISNRIISDFSFLTEMIQLGQKTTTKKTRNYKKSIQFLYSKNNTFLDICWISPRHCGKSKSEEWRKDQQSEKGSYIFPSSMRVKRQTRNSIQYVLGLAEYFQVKWGQSLRPELKLSVRNSILRGWASDQKN